MWTESYSYIGYCFDACGLYEGISFWRRRSLKELYKKKKQVPWPNHQHVTRAPASRKKAKCHEFRRHMRVGVQLARKFVVSRSVFVRGDFKSYSLVPSGFFSARCPWWWDCCLRLADGVQQVVSRYRIAMRRVDAEWVTSVGAAADRAQLGLVRGVSQCDRVYRGADVPQLLSRAASWRIRVAIRYIDHNVIDTCSVTIRRWELQK